MSDKVRGCKQLEKLLKAETKIIKDHISEHKWFQHIPDEDKGMIDFIEKYGWIMREMYCGFACPDRIDCEIAQQFLSKEEKDEKTDEAVSDEQQKSSDI